MAPGPPNTFLIPDSLSKYKISPRAYLDLHKDEIDHLVTGTIVTHNSRILVVKRSPTDYLPRCWEIPGGSCDDADATIVSAACRETWEETGLCVTAVVGVVADRHDWVDVGSRWRKMTFLVEVEKNGNVEEGQQQKPPVVRLDPNEHCDFFWVSEAEILGGGWREKGVRWTSEEQRQTILKAFRMIK